MAITIDWGVKVINIPKVDLTFISGSLYELDINSFRLRLKDLEDDEEGMNFPTTHEHNTETILSGTTFARQVNIINGYTVTFEDGQYRVRLSGANSNISDVTNLNQVSILSQNSAGLIVGGVGGSTDPWLTPLPAGYPAGTAGNIVGTKLDSAVSTVIGRLPSALVGGKMDSTLSSGEREAIAVALLALADGVEDGYTVKQSLRLMAAVLCGKVSGGPGSPVFRNMPDTAARVAATADSGGNRTSVTLTP